MVISHFLQALRCNFACFALQNFFLYMLCAVNRYASCQRFFLNFFPENLALVWLFVLFFQRPGYLRHLSAEMVLCVLIRHPLAGHSVLYSITFLQLLLIFVL